MDTNMWALVISQGTANVLRGIYFRATRRSGFPPAPPSLFVKKARGYMSERVDTKPSPAEYERYAHRVSKSQQLSTGFGSCSKSELQWLQEISAM